MKTSLLVLFFTLVFNSLLAQLTNNMKREGDKTDPAINPIYKYYEWEDNIPDDCPFERSEDISKVMFTGRYANYTGADTWYLQSGGDGNLYSCWTDGEIDGFATNSNIRSNAVGQARITGHDPINLRFENIGRMWSGGTNYYPCVSLIVDGTFYIGTFNAFNHEGYFVFSDGSMEWMYAAPANSAVTPAEISFPSKRVKWVKFTITKGSAEISTATTLVPGKRLGISEIEVFEAK